MKVSIFAFAVNDKFPIDIVKRQYEKFLKDDYEFIIFNDAPNAKMQNNIEIITKHNNIKCVNVPQNMHKHFDPSQGYAETLNWAVHEYAAKQDIDIVVLSHTDIFPICKTSILDIIGNYTVASTTEFRKIGDEGITYLYPAFTVINMKLLNAVGVGELDFGLFPGVDTGGKTAAFIKKYPDLVKLLPNHQVSYFLRTLDENESLAQYLKEDLEISKAHGLSSGWVSDGIFHYMAGSQWNSGDKSIFAIGNEKRMNLFLKYFY